jgi:Ca2+-binding RTX toxin-like protein
VIKGGLTLNGALNLLAPNQNLPFAHVVQAWDSGTGAPLPGYPVPSDDFQLVSQPAVARVGGPAGERQTLYGTGLYQLHAYGPGGAEPADWPKFLGGWVQATPSVGDVDGDGELDVAAVTREGWSFLWGTGAPACTAGSTSTNQEWWTFHHDEHGTANYGHDARPPGTATGLAAAAGANGVTELSWAAPGDDWMCGSAESLRVIVADGPINSPGDGETVVQRGAGGGVGHQETATLSVAQRGGATHAAVLYRDDAGNWGLVRGVQLPPQPPDGPGPDGSACSNAIAGTAKADKLAGTPGSDRIRGRGGKDRLKGRGGDDCVAGQGGADRISGGAGADELRGGRGNDRLRGGPGDDVIRVHRGARDHVNCGPGRDTVVLNRKRDRAKRNCERLTFAKG